ncbi:hypothetical protein TWF106_000051 [Orbilia oligospora]|uniref:Uncharacterized protein n=1 Tax=Orbilia oligospora TaxID=2813651 RepID=A0A6G1ML21_ORBOL|nr:hypothetical protein TWF788_008104 [Orbilia oligospora]KAF3221754.1 hypothetical protein TWF679_006967 [Orbilia oligospora]KAF3229664.1 hypothetical protein TWF106_000051 [Orbilia oligospora]KAF3230100.1 hypothetical protein TWF191_000341 [Orbilia oligospora]KAF3262490.1 hypothetical protein TWF192_007166 [Orbilia oligospora]
MPTTTVSSPAMASQCSNSPLGGLRKSTISSAAWKLSAVLSLAGPIYPQVNKEVERAWGQRIERLGTWWACVQAKNIQNSEACRELLGFGKELVHFGRIAVLIPTFLIAVGVFSLVLNIFSLLWAVGKRMHREVGVSAVPQETPSRIFLVEPSPRVGKIQRRHSAAF